MMFDVSPHNPLLANKLPSPPPALPVMPTLQEDYYLHIYSLIRDNFAQKFMPKSCLYLAMGPDLSTPLLLFNAKKIEGIDLANWDLKKMEQYLLSSDLTNFSREALQARENRFRGGFWNYSDYQKLGGWQEILLIELLHLGVKPEESYCRESKQGKIILEFNWQHPLENLPEKRQVILNSKTSLEDWLKNLAPKKQFDCYLDKGVNFSNSLPKTDRPLLKEALRTSALFFSSPEYSGVRDQEGKYPGAIKSFFGSELNSLSLRGAKTGEIEQSLRTCFPLFAWGYGWKLEGYSFLNNQIAQRAISQN